MVNFVCIHMHKLQTLQTSKWTLCVCACAHANFKRLASIHGILNHIVIIWRYFRLFNGFSEQFLCVCVCVCGDFIRKALNVVRTQFVTIPNRSWVHTLKAQTIQFVKREFVRLGLGHWTVVRHGFHSNLHKGEPDVSNNTLFRYVLSSSGRPRPRSFMFLLFSFFRTSQFGRRFVPPFLNCSSFLFIQVFTLLPTSTCRLNFLGLILVLSAYAQSGWGWL